nr:hypothetical protein [Allorhizobium pseudoryzae]
MGADNQRRGGQQEEHRKNQGLGSGECGSGRQKRSGVAEVFARGAVIAVPELALRFPKDIERRGEEEGKAPLAETFDRPVPLCLAEFGGGDEGDAILPAPGQQGETGVIVSVSGLEQRRVARLLGQIDEGQIVGFGKRLVIAAGAHQPFRDQQALHPVAAAGPFAEDLCHVVGVETAAFHQEAACAHRHGAFSRAFFSNVHRSGSELVVTWTTCQEILARPERFSVRFCSEFNDGRILRASFPHWHTGFRRGVCRERKD